nr:EAL domain-containing protein [Angustibacter aerolatus]
MAAPRARPRAARPVHPRRRAVGPDAPADRRGHRAWRWPRWGGGRRSACGCRSRSTCRSATWSTSSLVGRLRQRLAHHGVEPALLTLEITERVLTADLDTARITLEALRDLGVGLSLDDFGTGWSSLRLLREPAGHRDQDRPRLRLAGGDRARRRGRGARPDRDGPPARAAGGRRGHRDRGDLAAHRLAALRLRAGVAPGPAAARGRRHPLAGRATAARRPADRRAGLPAGRAGRGRAGCGRAACGRLTSVHSGTAPRRGDGPRP